jgi:hypothetical protein
MKKQFWIMPAMLFLLALAAVIYINMQDITPEKMVFAIDIASLTGISEAEAVTLLDNRRAEFDACLENESLPPPGGVLRIERGNGAVIFVLAEKYGSYTQYLAYGEAEEEYTSKGERGYNLGAHRRELEGGWTYCVDYVAKLTFADRYASQVDANLTDVQRAGLETPAAEGRYVLLKKDYAPYPAGLAKGQYAVRVTLKLKDGGELAGCLDPKTKVFIGWEK